MTLRDLKPAVQNPSSKKHAFLALALCVYCIGSGYIVKKGFNFPVSPTVSNTDTTDNSNQSEERSSAQHTPEFLAALQEARDAIRQGTFFERLAYDYDSRVRMDEFVMYLPILRNWLVRSASGEVLELGAGTGRNSKYYPKGKVTSLTMLDSSAKMLVHASRPNGIPLRRLVADARTVPFGDNSFDTVVATFVLCSVDDHMGMLREALRVLRPGGRLLLLDHGTGHYSFINRLLRRTSEHHLRMWGCVHNLEVGQLIEKAIRDPDSGCEIAKLVDRSRYHFGTTWKHVIEKI